MTYSREKKDKDNIGFLIRDVASKKAMEKCL